MSEQQRDLTPAEIERQLLGALCSTRLDAQTRFAIFDCLAAHTFVDPDGEIIFQALAKMPRASNEHVRETLGARLTRLGFPDIDVAPFLDLPPLPPGQIDSLLRQLKG